MPELSKFEKSVYIAIDELTSISPDGELTYTKILTCYLNGSANKEIPWAAIQKSKVYGKFPKSNLLGVMMACNKLVETGLLKKIKVGSNYKYFKTSKRLEQDSQPKAFSERISKYKNYLLQNFISFITEYCPSIKAIEHENYYGFINKNPIHFNEYNWFWLTDESKEPNSLKLFIRYRPNMKSIASTLNLSQLSFNEVVDELIDILDNEKAKYKLKFNRSISYPQLQGPVSKPKVSTKIEESEYIDISFFTNDGEYDLFVNDGGDASVNASLSVSESSPYKYGGDTVFSPKELQKIAQGKHNFDFSFLKWKVVAWTISRDDHSFIQNVLLVNKKNKDSCVFVSIPKRKVLCVTTKEFYIDVKEKERNSAELIKEIFERLK